MRHYKDHCYFHYPMCLFVITYDTFFFLSVFVFCTIQALLFLSRTMGFFCRTKKKQKNKKNVSSTKKSSTSKNRKGKSIVYMAHTQRHTERKPKYNMRGDTKRRKQKKKIILSSAERRLLSSSNSFSVENLTVDVGTYDVKPRSRRFFFTRSDGLLRITVIKYFFSEKKEDPLNCILAQLYCTVQ